MAAFTQALDLDLQPLDRRIDETRGAARQTLFAQHVPGFDRLPQFEPHARVLHAAAEREAELSLRLEPGRIEGVACALKIVQDLEEIAPDEMFEHVAVVQSRSPAHRLAVERRAPEPGNERAQQQLLGETHACVRRHFERAELDETEPAGRPVRRKQFVDADFGAVGIAGHIDQEVAEQTVDEPRRRRLVQRRHLAERDFKLVEHVLARFVDARRLARRPDEQSGKEIRQRRPPLPIEHQAFEEIGPAQERAVGGVAAAEDDVIAAAGSAVPAVDHELVGAEPREMRLLVESARDRDGFPPRRRRMDIDLDDAGVRRHLDDVEPRVGRRLIAFDVHRQAELGGGGLDRCKQFEIIGERFDRRHEDAQASVPHLDGQSRAHRYIGATGLGGCAGSLHHQRLGREWRRYLLDVSKRPGLGSDA